MTITADLRPTSPLPGAIMSNPDLTKLYMSASCPELKAESVISSSDEEEESYERFEPLMETHEEDHEAAFSMDAAVEVTAELPTVLADEAIESELPLATEAEATVTDTPAIVEEEEPVITVDQSRPELLPSISSLSTSSSTSSDLSTRRKLQWEFKGLTLWLELEEFDQDITRAVEDFSSRHSSPFIPKPHTTAIYGMEHLSVEDAVRRLRRVKDVIGAWPAFAKPTGVTSDIAVCGRPGQVCSIAWSELTLASNPAHEAALDALYQLFYSDSSLPEVPVRDRPWKPHNSIAYDNPETNALSLLDTVIYASKNPTLLGRERRVEAISLWSTEGKMEEWCCIDRVRFW